MLFLKPSKFFRKSDSLFKSVYHITPRSTNKNAQNCFSIQSGKCTREVKIQEPRVIEVVNKLPKCNFVEKNFGDLAKNLNILRTDYLGNFSGHKSYFLMNDLSKLEHAIIKFVLKYLLEQNFKLLSVPDILPSKTIEGCGMATTGERTQVYKLSNGYCLSGTAEMALAGYFENKIIEESDLPMKLVAVSRCYRAETSSLLEERGLYRVHQFTKVEMFAVTRPEESDQMLEYFNKTEITLFNKLGLHFQVLDMPPDDLSVAASRKYDIEAWMPGRKLFGEISSCSNCTDYQTKQLDIKLNTGSNMQYPHTINGTACAIPRLLISILECNQRENGSIGIPIQLQEFMGGRSEITKTKKLPELKLIKKFKN